MTTYIEKEAARWDRLHKEAERVLGSHAICEVRRGGVVVYADPILRKWDSPYILTPDVDSAIAALKMMPDRSDRLRPQP
jgi:hypothetical protein